MIFSLIHSNIAWPKRSSRLLVAEFLIPQYLAPIVEAMFRVHEDGYPHGRGFPFRNRNDGAFG